MMLYSSYSNANTVADSIKVARAEIRAIVFDRMAFDSLKIRFSELYLANKTYITHLQHIAQKTQENNQQQNLLVNKQDAFIQKKQKKMFLDKIKMPLAIAIAFMIGTKF